MVVWIVQQHLMEESGNAKNIVRILTKNVQTVLKP